MATRTSSLLFFAAFTLALAATVSATHARKALGTEPADDAANLPATKPVNLKAKASATDAKAHALADFEYDYKVVKNKDCAYTCKRKGLVAPQVSARGTYPCYNPARDTIGMAKNAGACIYTTDDGFVKSLKTGYMCICVSAFSWVAGSSDPDALDCYVSDRVCSSWRTQQSGTYYNYEDDNGDLVVGCYTNSKGKEVWEDDDSAYKLLCAYE